jgi:hypothetical protein
MAEASSATTNHADIATHVQVCKRMSHTPHLGVMSAIDQQEVEILGNFGECFLYALESLMVTRYNKVL